MNALLLLRSHINTAYAPGVVFLGSLALNALRLNLPTEFPGFELLLIGWLGVGLGRLALGADSAATGREAAPKPVARAETLDRLRRSIAKLIQSHVSNGDAFSQRLHGASVSLSRHAETGHVNEIVMALIQDNRDMRDKLSNLRNQLGELRLQVLRLQNTSSDLKKPECGTS